MSARQESGRNVMVGLFVLFGMGALVALSVMFGASGNLPFAGGQQAYTIDVRLPSASGVAGGTMVTAGGIRIGSVQSVRFVDSASLGAGVVVSVQFEEPYRLRTGARALVTEPGMGMGRPPIQIFPGPEGAAQLASGSTIQGQIKSAVETLIPGEMVRTLDTTLQQIGSAAEKLNPVLDDMHEIMRARAPADVNETMQGNLSSAVARLDLLIKELSALIADPALREDIHVAIGNFREMSEKSIKVVDDLQATSADLRSMTPKVEQLLDKGHETLSTLDQSVVTLARAGVDDLDRAGRILDDLAIVSGRLRNGEGALGKLSADDELYNALTLTVRRLTEMVDEFKLLAEEWRKGKVRVAL
ncbi:MAG: MCE family protein [Phycisphaerales bacterium]|nr:MCE family protein [Phycisphaerales bacterium]